MVKAGIFGATGYTGLELARILSSHSHVEITFATSETHAGLSLADIFPVAPDLPLIPTAAALERQAEVVFLCLPHGAATSTAVAALETGRRVVDLSADFRLRNAATYAQWYGSEHPAPQLLGEAIYGLTEFVRADLPDARLVANPGCYPTSVLLALQPLLVENGIAARSTVIIDSKAGVSGAGRAPKQNLQFAEVADNLSPYNVGRAHRHLPEMEQELGSWSTSPPTLVFSPHLLPVPRGILSTIYVPLADGWAEDRIRTLYEKIYADEPFVRVLPPVQLATLAHVRYTNQCAIGLAFAEQILIVTSAIDNLVKGAAGQAVQNMNVMFGIPEALGLE